MVFKRASIDLGTNTCLLLIAECDALGEVCDVFTDISTIVRLGEGVDKNRMLSDVAMDRTVVCLKDYAARVKAAGIAVGEAICVATSQARDAGNSADFFAMVERGTGFKFRVISGDDEARLTFLGSLSRDMNPENSAVIDIGGGSTEIISHSGGISMDIGSVRFTERFLKSDPVTDNEFWSCQQAIDDAIVKAGFIEWRSSLPASVRFIAVAGTATTLAAWYLGLEKFDAAKVGKVVLSRGDIHRMVEELKWRTITERGRLQGIEPARADVILCGAMILWRVMEMLKFYECNVSARGLRYGVLKRAPIN
ncbi:MAG: Ppx/GppA phosphatase family protein [Bdellovibrionota bacterium]